MTTSPTDGARAASARELGTISVLVGGAGALLGASVGLYSLLETALPIRLRDGIVVTLLAASFVGGLGGFGVALVATRLKGGLDRAIGTGLGLGLAVVLAHAAALVWFVVSLVRAVTHLGPVR